LEMMTVRDDGSELPVELATTRIAIAQYGHTAWRIQDGYFAGYANSIAQTTDGFLWVGTSAGLLRFDGVQFIPWASLTGEQASSNDIHVLPGVRDGSLWIGTTSGLVHWVNQHSIRYLDGEQINDLEQDEKGHIWAVGVRPGGNTHPLCRITNFSKSF
jgi:ligand-binding sensor domain-containing protein